jgi:hypothetical protein
MTRLYDLVADPRETIDVARLPENRQIVDDLIGVLAAHMKATAHDPDSVPKTRDPYTLLADALPPTELRGQRRS